MFDVLRGTPLWVYAVFLVLTYYGVTACFKHDVTKRSLQITPVVFIAIALISLDFSHGVAIPLSVFGLGLFIGWVLALRFYLDSNATREGDRLVLTGTWKVLAVYWVFFAWRYYSGYQAATHPELADEVFAVVWSALGAGLINGLIVGRSLGLLAFFKADKRSVAEL